MQIFYFIENIESCVARSPCRRGASPLHLLRGSAWPAHPLSGRGGQSRGCPHAETALYGREGIASSMHRAKSHRRKVGKQNRL